MDLADIGICSDLEGDRSVAIRSGNKGLAARWGKNARCIPLPRELVGIAIRSERRWSAPRQARLSEELQHARGPELEDFASAVSIVLGSA